MDLVDRERLAGDRVVVEEDLPRSGCVDALLCSRLRHAVEEDVRGRLGLPVRVEPIPRESERADPRGQVSVELDRREVPNLVDVAVAFIIEALHPVVWGRSGIRNWNHSVGNSSRTSEG